MASGPGQEPERLDSRRQHLACPPTPCAGPAAPRLTPGTSGPVILGFGVGALDFLGKTVTVADQRTRRAPGVMFVHQSTSDAGRRAQRADCRLEHVAARRLGAVAPDALVFVAARGAGLDDGHWRQRVWIPATTEAGTLEPAASAVRAGLGGRGWPQGLVDGVRRNRWTCADGTASATSWRSNPAGAGARRLDRVAT